MLVDCIQKSPAVNHRCTRTINWCLAWPLRRTLTALFSTNCVSLATRELCMQRVCMCNHYSFPHWSFLKIAGSMDISIKVIDYSLALRIPLSKTKAIDAIHCCCNSIYSYNIKIIHLHLTLEAAAAAVVWWLNLGYTRITDLAFCKRLSAIDTFFTLSTH